MDSGKKDRALTGPPSLLSDAHSCPPLLRAHQLLSPNPLPAQIEGEGKETQRGRFALHLGDGGRVSMGSQSLSHLLHEVKMMLAVVKIAPQISMT